MLRNMETADTEALKRWAAIKEFLHILVDLPCIAVGLAVCCTWRMPIIVWRFFQLAVSAPVRSQAGLRSLPWAEFATLFIDIPAIALSPFALATWRIYPTWLAAKQVYAFEKGTSRHDNKGWSQQRFRRAQEATLRSAIVANGLYVTTTLSPPPSHFCFWSTRGTLEPPLPKKKGEKIKSIREG